MQALFAEKKGRIRTELEENKAWVWRQTKIPKHLEKIIF